MVLPHLAVQVDPEGHVTAMVAVKYCNVTLLLCPLAVMLTVAVALLPPSVPVMAQLPALGTRNIACPLLAVAVSTQLPSVAVTVEPLSTLTTIHAAKRSASSRLKIIRPPHCFRMIILTVIFTVGVDAAVKVSCASPWAVHRTSELM